MSIPEKCTVLVVGGGPGGSYTAAALAREGIDTVLLESAVFPRYHIGESMLPSMRHLLRFIDLDSTFDSYGFTKKVGGAFKLSPHQREGYTDFLAARGPENYTWNVIRSEADNLIFQHARASGAAVFDGVKVNEVFFTPMSPESDTGSSESPSTRTGRPVSAAWQNKAEGKSGTISFDYIVDASGRAGLLNNYTKGRQYNTALNNVASWAYWRGTDAYASGTDRANAPFFEALRDESGWAWLIPLHNGTTSVGIVMKQELQVAKKKAMSGASSKDFYLESLKLAPNLLKLIGDATMETEIKNASDFSYNSSSYASPYARVVGDAGCFIDPFFSSGVHLAMVGGLSAATTISAAIKGDVEESVAAKWHSGKIGEGYSRFLLVVLSAYKQMRKQDQSILSGVDADNFDEAFNAFKPVIQGTADTTSELSQVKLDETINFCANAFDSVHPEDRVKVLDKVATAIGETTGENQANPPSLSENEKQSRIDALRESLDDEEKRVLDFIRARRIIKTEETLDIDHFTTNIIDGKAPHLERGKLTLIDAKPPMDMKTSMVQSVG